MYDIIYYDCKKEIFFMQFTKTTAADWNDDSSLLKDSSLVVIAAMNPVSRECDFHAKNILISLSVKLSDAIAIAEQNRIKT
jgi:hypothetical protein